MNVAAALVMPAEVTVKLRGPVVADAPIVRFTVKDVELVTETAPTVIAVPTSTVVDPDMKLVPFTGTATVDPRAALEGLIEVMVGLGK